MRICRAVALLAALQGIGNSTAFAPLGSTLGQHSNFVGPRVASTSVPRQRVRQHLRTFSNGRAAPHMLFDITSSGGQKYSALNNGAAAEGEDMSRTERASIVIDRELEHCYNVAADLDNYMSWCRKGGMKEIEILQRLEDNMCPLSGNGRADTVRFKAGKLGVDMLNVMQYGYHHPEKVSFRSLEGDVMKKMVGCYEFKPTGAGATEVTYNLDLEFGFKLPDFARQQIMGAIMRTALNALKLYCETGVGPK